MCLIIFNIKIYIQMNIIVGNVLFITWIINVRSLSFIENMEWLWKWLSRLSCWMKIKSNKWRDSHQRVLDLFTIWFILRHIYKLCTFNYSVMLFSSVQSIVSSVQISKQPKSYYMSNIFKSKRYKRDLCGNQWTYCLYYPQNPIAS